MQIPTLSNLGSIFETNDSFEIPRFQRPYEWSEKDQISDLWADICSSARSGRDHFIGSLIIMPLSDTTKFMLIDGQQRLITLTILIRVLRDVVQSEGNMNWPNLCSDALYIRNYSRRRVDRVASDKGKYNAIMDSTGHYEGKQLCCEKCYQFFYRQIKAIADGQEPGLDVLTIMKTVWYRIKIMPIKVDNEDPCILFESINNTGKKLTPISMMRNYVMLKCVSLENDQNAGMIQKDIDESYWTSFNSLCKESDLGEYLRIFLTTKYGRVSKSDLYRTAKEYVNSYFDPCTNHEELKNAANLLFTPLTNSYYFYKQVLGLSPFDSGTASVNYVTDIQNAISIINDHGFKSHRSFMLKLLMDYDKKKDDEGKHNLEDLKALRDKVLLVESFIIRRAIVQNIPNNTVDGMFIELSQIDDITFDTLYNKLDSMENRGYWPSDSDLTDALNRKEFYNGVTEKLCYSILKRISAYTNDNNTEKIEDVAPSTEHIFPQHPEKWIDSLTSEDFKYLNDHVHFIGNLTPLTRPKNSDAGNEPYAEKLGIYAKSNYALTNKIEKKYGKTWSVAQFNQRQKDMINAILHIWKRSKDLDGESESDGTNVFNSEHTEN